MTFEAFLETAWSDHADRAQEVADRLAASTHLVQAPGQVAPFVHLLTHVYGEHLGAWQRGVELLESLRGLPAVRSRTDAAGPLDRAVATLRYAGGDGHALDTLSAQDRVCALATASSALAGRDDIERAIAAYGEALAIAKRGLSDGSPAIRALAVGGNNLAATLEGKADRSDAESQAMLLAAEAALDYWKQAGTWLEEERAEYRLTRSRLQAGQPLAAMRSAQRCVDVCARNDAPPFERFFAHAVLAIAHRAAGKFDAFQAQRLIAVNCHEQLDADDREACESELRELGSRP